MSHSKHRGIKNKCLPLHNNPSIKGADQDMELALALSISMLPQIQDINPDQLDQGFVIPTAKTKRKRVRLDETEVPTLLVTSNQDYSASVMRRAHNLLDVSSHGTSAADTSADMCEPQEYSLWNLASLPEVGDEVFVVDLLRQINPMAGNQAPQVTTDSYTLVYTSGLPLPSSLFSSYLLNPFLSDTIIITKELHKIPSHLFILAAHSALIRDLIAERYSMKRILMRGHEVDTVIPLLEFMYSGKFQFENIHLDMVRRLASILQMDAFLTCLEEHQRIANPAQERDLIETTLHSQEIASTQSKSSQSSLPELFSKVQAKKDCPTIGIS